jgi:hypothetical protein
MNVTRRGFFTRAAALVATTALVPAAIAILTEAERRAKLHALIDEAMERAKVRIVAELNEMLWGEGYGDKGGLADLVNGWHEDQARITPARGLRYAWKQHSSIVSITHA